MPAKINVYCGGIVCDHEAEVEVPDWSGVVDLEERRIYHPDCALQGEFFSAVCPGCVDSFPGCDLSGAYAYGRRRTITGVQLATIEGGVCPFRINGTFGFIVGGGKIVQEKIDLSEVAPNAAGQAVAEAIREYIRKYPDEK